MHPRAPSWFGPILLLVVGAMLLSWSWMKWPDPMIDFGAQLYTPWRITEGDLLVRDIQTLYGPLSPYLNAMIFKVFGVSLRTLVFTNMFVMIGLVAVLYRLLSQLSNHFAATIACLVFLTVFGFSQYLVTGNYNFATPYVEEISHGLLLAMAALLALIRFGKTGRRRYVAICGFLLGLTVLTKPEPAVAGSLSILLGLPMMLRARGAKPTTCMRAIALFVGSALLPIAVCVALFSLAVPTSDALGNTLHAWRYLLRSQVTRVAFYRTMMGTDDLSGNLLRMLASLGGYVAMVLAGGIVSLAIARRRWYARLIGFVAGGAVAWLLLSPDKEPIGAAAMPILMAALVGISAWQFFRAGGSAEGSTSIAGRLTLAVFALVMLGRMLFKARFAHYGFALAMPAALLTTVALLDWLPNLLAHRHGLNAAAAFRSIFLAVILVFATKAVILSGRYYSLKNYPVGHGDDQFFGDRRALLLDALLNFIDANVAPDQTLSVLPENTMVNYLSRRRTPNEYITLVPPGFFPVGEENILNTFQSHPPDCIVLAHRETSEFGYPLFMRDYAQHFGQWIEANYQPVYRFGAQPFVASDQYGILVMQRR